MSFTKEEIINEMKRTRLVPLLAHSNAEDVFQIVKTTYDAGLRIFEFTNRNENAFDVYKFLLEKRSAYPEMKLGIGTVMDDVTTRKFLEAGADFIISPILKTSMAPLCHSQNKLWIPGCATLTEIVTAKEHGAEVIKVFPGSVLGPGFVSSILPVVPGLRLMVTGGVEPTFESLSAWFKAGAMCVGLGSQLFEKSILEVKDWKKLHENIRNAIGLVKDIEGK